MLNQKLKGQHPRGYQNSTASTTAPPVGGCLQACPLGAALGPEVPSVGAAALHTPPFPSTAAAPEFPHHALRTPSPQNCAQAIGIEVPHQAGGTKPSQLRHQDGTLPPPANKPRCEAEAPPTSRPKPTAKQTNHAHQPSMKKRPSQGSIVMGSTVVLSVSWGE